jgi:hypothetical protein
MSVVNVFNENSESGQRPPQGLLAACEREYR